MSLAVLLPCRFPVGIARHISQWHGLRLPKIDQPTSRRIKSPICAERHVRRASTHEVPTCARCGARMVLRTGQSGARKGQKFWGCSNYPACRYTKNLEEDA